MKSVYRGIVALFACFFCLNFAFANPVDINYELIWRNEIALFLPVYLFSLGLAFLVEFAVIFLFLKKLVKVLPLLLTVLLADLISISGMFLAIILFRQDFDPIMLIVLLEFCVFVLESIFYVFSFRFLSRLKQLKKPVGIKKTIMITLLANVVSFIVGYFVLPIYF